MFDIDTVLGAPGEPCRTIESCSYLRALAKLEELAGFEATAQSFVQMAEGCRSHGCWRKRMRGGTGTATERPRLVPFPARSVDGTRGVQALRGGAIGGAPTPFSRTVGIDIARDSAGNYVERRSLEFGALTAADPLGYLHRYWLWLGTATSRRLADLDTTHLIRAGVIGTLHIVDVSDPDPDGFRFELLGYALPSSYHLESPRAFPVTIYAETTIRDYNTVRMTASPLLQRIRAHLVGKPHHYTRLILPFHDKRNRVVRLAVAVRLEPGDCAAAEAVTD